jgi:hypothetical protein
MALKKMIVSADKGGEDSATARFPYQFYAKEKTEATQTKVVNLVMPIGGKETGFFRYPKAEENILVDDDGASSPSYYLIGYLPSEMDEENNFLTNKQDADNEFNNEVQALKAEEGMILRYQQTGKKDPSNKDERYSEIGFYHRPTQWKTSDQDSYNDVADSIPKIDQINIQSTGDIHTKAKNHHQVKAKRIEILSNVEESDFSKDLKKENRPFGDKSADISDLLQGDIHIRGKRRIILKAGSEIRLEVGRSTIIISDAGIILTSRKTHSDIHNPFDTVLSILPRDGITMFGQHLKLAAAYAWGIEENMGSSIKGTAGIMRILGKDIKASTISGAAYITNFVSQTLAFGANLTSMSIGTHDSDNVQDSQMPSYGGMVAGLSGILINVLIGLKYDETGSIDDPDSKIVKFAALALSMIGTVVGAIETIYISPEDKKGKDALALAALIAEWGCLLPIFIAMCTASVGPFMVHNDTIHWDNNGNLTLIGAKIKNIAIDEKFINSPIAGGNLIPERDEDKWSNKLKDWIKENKALFALITIGGLVGIGGVLTGIVFGASATTKRMDSLSEEEEKLFKELNEL